MQKKQSNWSDNASRNEPKSSGNSTKPPTGDPDFRKAKDKPLDRSGTSDKKDTSKKPGGSSPEKDKDKDKGKKKGG